jgi:hypothetical protein
MAITDQQGTISLVDPDSGAELNQIRGLLNDDLAAVEFSSDGTLMLSMSGATVQLWDPLSGQQIDVPFPHNGSDPPRIGDGDANSGLTSESSFTSGISTRQPGSTLQVRPQAPT